MIPRVAPPAAAAATASAPSYSSAPPAAGASASGAVSTPDGGWRMKPKKYAASKSVGDGYLQNVNTSVPTPAAPAAAAAPVSAAAPAMSTQPTGGWRMKPKKYAASKSVGDSYLQSM